MKNNEPTTIDSQLLIRTIDLATQRAKAGFSPYAAIIVNNEGKIIAESVNTTKSDGLNHHAEINAIESAIENEGVPTLNNCTLYSSTEPCPMCAGAIAWSGLSRVVFGLSIERFRKELSSGEHQIALSCREVFNRAPRKINVSGPLHEELAITPHKIAEKTD